MTRAVALDLALEIIDNINTGCGASACRVRPGKMVGPQCRCNPQIVQKLRLLAQGIEHNPIHDTSGTN